MNPYPKIGSEIILTSDRDLDRSVFDCLKSIPCDRFFTRRASEHDRALYAVNADGLYEWKGTECSLSYRPKSCLAIEDSFLEMRRSLEPFWNTICQMQQQYELRTSMQFTVFLDESMLYPEMVITKNMIQDANRIGSELLITCEIDCQGDGYHGDG